jgi:hypothetical protein
MPVPSARVVVPQGEWIEDWSDPERPFWSATNGPPDVLTDGPMGGAFARLPGASGTQNIGRLMSSLFVDDSEPSSGRVRARINAGGTTYWNAISMLWAGEVNYDGFSIMGATSPHALRLGNADFNGAVVGDGLAADGEVLDLEWEYSGNGISPSWLRGRKNGGAWATKTAPTSGTGYLWPYQYAHLRLPFSPLLIALTGGAVASKVDFGPLELRGRILHGACDGWIGWLDPGTTRTNCAIACGIEPVPGGSYPNWTTTPIPEIRDRLGGITGVDANGTYDANLGPTPLYPHTHGSGWVVRNGLFSWQGQLTAPKPGYRYKALRLIARNVQDDLKVYVRDSITGDLLSGISGNSAGLLPNTGPNAWGDWTVDLTGIEPGRELYLDVQGETSTAKASTLWQQPILSARLLSFEPVVYEISPRGADFSLRGGAPLIEVARPSLPRPSLDALEIWDGERYRRGRFTLLT